MRIGRQRLSRAQTWALAHVGRRLELGHDTPTTRHVHGHPATIRKLDEYGLLEQTWHRAGRLTDDALEHARTAYRETVRRCPAFAIGWQPAEDEVA